MPKIIMPKWEDFDDIVCSAASNLIICCPYYSKIGIDSIYQNVDDNISLSFFTRLSPSDWVSGVSDPEELVTFLELRRDAGYKVCLWIHQRLHAKIYIADKDKALVGSSNLSEGGFDRNLEVMVRLLGREARQAWNIIDKEIRPVAIPVEIAHLRSWVNSHLDTITSIGQYREDISVDELESAQKDLDVLLGYGEKGGEIVEPGGDDIEYFVEWLRENPNLTGANTLVARYDNLDNQNLTGHFKQCFFAIYRFLNEYIEIPAELTRTYDRESSSSMYKIPDQILELWIEHIDAHATDVGEGYSYSTLRSILPPSLGGTREGGGGASSTLKRMLPLIGKFIYEERQ